MTSYFAMDPWGDGHCWVHLNVSSHIQGFTETFHLSQNWLKHWDPFISLVGDLTDLICEYHSTQSLVWGHLNCIVLNMLANQSGHASNCKRLSEIFLHEFFSFPSLSESDGYADPPACSGAAPVSQAAECESAGLHLHQVWETCQNLELHILGYFCVKKGKLWKHSTAKGAGNCRLLADMLSIWFVWKVDYRKHLRVVMKPS